MGQSVLIVCGRLWGEAAVENRARYEAEAFAAAGMAVSLLTQQPVDDHVRARWPGLVALDPVVAEPRGFWGRRTSTKLLTLVGSTARLLNGGRGAAIRTVVSHSEAGVVGALWWRRRRKGKLVYVCHTSPRPPRSDLPRRHRAAAHLVHEGLEWLAIRSADLVVCPAPASRNFYGARRSKPTIAVENPVDLERFTPDPAVVRDVDVLYVGRLAPEKGAAVLLEALARVPLARRTVVAGQGSERPRLEALASACPGAVEFLGAVPNDELTGWYRRARVVVVPSFTEAAGMVPIEAMACATPVVASRVGGLVDSVHEGENGWLVPVGDAEALAAVLERVLADEPARAGAGERALRSVDRFDARRFGGRVTSDYGITG